MNPLPIATPLILGIKSGNDEVVSLLLQNRRSFEISPLKVSIQKSGAVELVFKFANL